MASVVVVVDPPSPCQAALPKNEISGGSSVSTGVDSIKLAIKPVRSSTHQQQQPPTKKFWKRLTSMIVQTSNNKDGQSKKTNKSENDRRPTTKNKQPQPFARGVFIEVPPLPVVVLPDVTATTLTAADPGLLEPVASFADQSDKTIDTAGSNLSLSSTAVPAPAPVLLPQLLPAASTTTTDENVDDTTAQQHSVAPLAPRPLPPMIMELGRWTASNCDGHDTHMPVLVRKPEYESFGEDDDKKLLAKVLVQARTLPANSGKYASNHVMINGERLKRRCPPLSRSVVLDGSARRHAAQMASSNRLVHPDDPADVWKELWLSQQQGDTTVNSVGRLGSNLGRGKDLADIHKYMMLSAAERNNLLDKRYTAMGVGTARAANGTIFLCQLFSG